MNSASDSEVDYVGTATLNTRCFGDRGISYSVNGIVVVSESKKALTLVSAFECGWGDWAGTPGIRLCLKSNSQRMYLW